MADLDLDDSIAKIVQIDFFLRNVSKFYKKNCFLENVCLKIDFTLLLLAKAARPTMAVLVGDVAVHLCLHRLVEPFHHLP
jgi:hypothetical protein